MLGLNLAETQACLRIGLGSAQSAPGLILKPQARLPLKNDGVIFPRALKCQFLLFYDIFFQR